MNPGLWNPESPERLLSGIHVPLTTGIGNPVSGIGIPESRAWNPESTTVLDSLTSLFGNKIISLESTIGLHAAAHDLDIPWIIIKGISDHKDGRKSGTDCWKKFASLMAASLTVHILSDPIVFQDWTHYSETSEYYNKLSATVTCFTPLICQCKRNVE